MGARKAQSFSLESLRYLFFAALTIFIAFKRQAQRPEQLSAAKLAFVLMSSALLLLLIFWALSAGPAWLLLRLKRGASQGAAENLRAWIQGLLIGDGLLEALSYLPLALSYQLRFDLALLTGALLAGAFLLPWYWQGRGLAVEWGVGLILVLCLYLIQALYFTKSGATPFLPREAISQVTTFCLTPLALALTFTGASSWLLTQSLGKTADYLLTPLFFGLAMFQPSQWQDLPATLIAAGVGALGLFLAQEARKAL